MKKQIIRAFCTIIAVLVAIMSMPISALAEDVFSESIDIYAEVNGEKLYCEYYN